MCFSVDRFYARQVEEHYEEEHLALGSSGFEPDYEPDEDFEPQDGDCEYVTSNYYGRG